MKNDNREEQEDEIDDSGDAVESESMLMLLSETTPNQWNTKRRSTETRDTVEMMTIEPSSSWSEHCPVCAISTEGNTHNLKCSSVGVVLPVLDGLCSLGSLFLVGPLHTKTIPCRPPFSSLVQKVASCTGTTHILNLRARTVHTVVGNGNGNGTVGNERGVCRYHRALLRLR